jgi:hypothetical protein
MHCCARGLEPPGKNPPAVQLVQENFYGMSGQWGRGHAWASFKPGTPGAAVEEAHWAGALLAATNLPLCDSDVCYEYEGPPLPRIAEGGQQGPEVRRRRQPYLLERLLALHTPAPPPAAAPAAGAAPAPPPAGPEAAYSYTWLAEEVLFVFMDAWAKVMDLKEWRRLLDINPALPFLPLLATPTKKLLVSGQELPASVACACSGCCPVADVHAADSQPAANLAASYKEPLKEPRLLAVLPHKASLTHLSATIPPSAG